MTKSQKYRLRHIRGNVRVISWRANILKGNGTAKEHLKIAQYIQSEEK